MRRWLARTALNHLAWVLAPLAVVAVMVVAGTWLLVFHGYPSSLAPTETPEPPPQAPASAPEPTLQAVAAEQPTPGETPEPSPFAGIAQPPAQPPQRTGLLHHAVADGEVLWQIAEQFGLRPETIVWANDIDNPDLLLVGQDLLIPPADGVLYTVRPGDRLADVADRYAVDLASIVSSNQLGDPDQIQAGVDLFLPGA
ncbi:MAG TPA: LysM peptidoglycan-binding domain-containing protein, partial [Chloroflexota bacterium]